MPAPDAPRVALARGRRIARGDAGRQSAGLTGRVPRRLRRAPTRTRSRARAGGRRSGLRASADVSSAAASLPRRFASLVRIEHTVFALPFAYVGAFLAVGRLPRLGQPALGDGGDGRRPDARDGPEPPHRRGARRAQPAYGDARDPVRAPHGRPGLRVCAALRSRSTSSRCSSSIRSCAGCGRSRSPSSSPTRT